MTRPQFYRTRVEANIYDLGNAFEVQMRFGSRVDRQLHRRCKTLTEARELRDRLCKDKQAHERVLKERKRERDRLNKPVKQLYSTEPRSSQPCECDRPMPLEGICFKCSKATDVPLVTLGERAA